MIYEGLKVCIFLSSMGISLQSSILLKLQSCIGVLWEGHSMHPLWVELLMVETEICERRSYNGSYTQTTAVLLRMYTCCACTRVVPRMLAAITDWRKLSSAWWVQLRVSCDPYCAACFRLLPRLVGELAMASVGVPWVFTPYHKFICFTTTRYKDGTSIKQHNISRSFEKNNTIQPFRSSCT